MTMLIDASDRFSPWVHVDRPTGGNCRLLKRVWGAYLEARNAHRAAPHCPYRRKVFTQTHLLTFYDLH